MSGADIKIVETVCPRNCYSACGLKVYVKDGKVIKTEGSDRNPATFGQICVKGRSYPELINSDKRLLYPLMRTGKRGEGKFERISWDKAMDIIYERFTDAGSRYGPESILHFIASGNHGSAMQNYALGFWNQLEGYSHTRGSLCAAAANVAVEYTYGIIKDSAIADIENSQLIIIWGKNPAYTNMHTMRYINNAVKKGAKLVTIDPRLNESSSKTNLHIFPRCGTDGLLAIAVAKFIVEEGLQDDEFISRHTYGFDEYKKLLGSYSMDDICRLTEIGREDLDELFELIKQTPRFTLILGKGFQRATNGGQTTRAISLLPALTGSVGRSGSGLFYSDSQKPKYVWPYTPPMPRRVRADINIGRLASELEQRSGPPIKAMWVERANPVTSNPNQGRLVKAMHKLDFIVCAEQFMTDTAVMSDIVLPVTMFAEENDLIYSYGHSFIQLKQKAAEGRGECKSDKDIYYMLGSRFGFDMKYLPEDDEEILRSVIEASGFKTTLEQMREKPYLFPEYSEIAFADLKFPTQSGRIEFYSESLHKDWGTDPLPVYSEPAESRYSAPELFERYPLIFMSAHPRERIHSQFTESEKLSKLNEPVVQIHSEDAEHRGIKDGDSVRVFNDRGEVFVKAQVGSFIKKGMVNIFEGWWNRTGAGVNILNEDRDTDIGYGTAYHNCLVEVRKADEKQQSQ